MSIASEITALTSDRTAIQTAISDMGGTVTSADGFDDFATAIRTIPGGVDGDNLAYGLSLVGSAIVGSSVVS